MHIVYVSDGKAGHRSQALGLFKAMQKQTHIALTFEEISIDHLPLLSLLAAYKKQKLAAVSQPPDYIVGVGSHTQFRVFLMGKVFPCAKTVILMKPNFPLSWFDHVVIPEHDGVPERANVIVTQGVLNPIENEQRHMPNRILIALGGSSKRHVWNADKVLSAIELIVQQNMQCEIILTSSRRTPADFLATLAQQSFASQLKIFPVEETPQGWIFEEMQKAEAVWVTEDSVSMIYEALTAGCQVGVIEIDRLKQDRITNSVDLLVQQKRLSLATSLLHLPKASALQEADRVAAVLL
ncbi:mitochondrial fission ELM1 family protein [Acinetobacter towneri]|uniref:mitochondrial fission ELM1 family protein n=1 Tax=Acinetobacter towneri TaxID=202956 RepID=UPI002DB70AC4|nr:ELM1/GtrOC1 family putative glycosyltransferase [Acinetobacter towneri]MEB6564827.1 mitochondrial fission ELM1 family protein [Acinetobacter towneri]